MTRIGLSDHPATGKTAAHTESETLKVAVNIPEHDARVTTPLFSQTRLVAIADADGRCWVCNRTAEESGHPLGNHAILNGDQITRRVAS